MILTRINLNLKVFDVYCKPILSANIKSINMLIGALNHFIT